MYPVVNVFNDSLLFHDGGLYNIETSPLICSADWFLYDTDLRHERVKQCYIKNPNICK